MNHAARDRLVHDLKNPLAAIRGYAELLRIRDDDETRREAAERILEASELLSRVVNEFADGSSTVAAVSPTPARTRGGGGKTVVIADDDELLRALLRLMLPGEGFAVLEAEDGDAALALVAEHEVVLLLLDLSMPGRSGLDVLAELRVSQPELPVIVVSADPDRGMPARTLALGATEFVTKPFGPLQLLALIHRHLELGELPGKRSGDQPSQLGS